MSHPLRIVDVFAERAREGNQLAVVLDAGDLSTDAMQSVAREMNFSETTFVDRREPRDGGYDVRIFTPTVELPFAGHPTLGTAWVIRNEIADQAGSVSLHLGVGKVPVRFETLAEGAVMPWLTAPPVTLGETFDREPVAAALGLDADDLDPRFPVQRVEAGIVLTTVPIRTLDALRRSCLDPLRFTQVVPQDFAAAHLFCAEPYSNETDLAARFFFDANGVREDPATGSATACLGAYLLEHDYFGKPELSLRVQQGVEIDRPSLLHLSGRTVDGRREVEVGGRVIPSVEGALL